MGVTSLQTEIMFTVCWASIFCNSFIFNTATEFLGYFHVPSNNKKSRLTLPLLTFLLTFLPLNWCFDDVYCEGSGAHVSRINATHFSN